MGSVFLVWETGLKSHGRLHQLMIRKLQMGPGWKAISSFISPRLCALYSRGAEYRDCTQLSCADAGVPSHVARTFQLALLGIDF